MITGLDIFRLAWTFAWFSVYVVMLANAWKGSQIAFTLVLAAGCLFQAMFFFLFLADYQLKVGYQTQQCIATHCLEKAK